MPRVYAISVSERSGARVVRRRRATQRCLGDVALRVGAERAPSDRGCASTARQAITASDRIDRGKDDVAKPQSRFRNWAFLAAFTLIISLTIAEGVDEGFSFWDWLVIAVSAVFIVQSLLRLSAGRSGRT
jgi:hypothetical protein